MVDFQRVSHNISNKMKQLIAGSNQKSPNRELTL